MHAEIFWKAFKESAVEYLQNASLNGIQLLYHIKEKKYQRILWSIFLMGGIVCAFLLTLVTILEKPTVTVLETNEYSIHKLPFPGVSVCSVNKLSRRAVNEYINEIRTQLDSPETHEKWLQKMKLFAGFFDTGSVDFKEAAKFQEEFLDKQKYNIRQILERLAPKCEDMLLKCRWDGEMHECNKLFARHFTTDGYCCIFNYVRKSNGKKVEVKYAKDVNIINGLTLFLNTSKDDYFLTDRSFAGFTLNAFNFADFPDATIGGSAHEYFVPQGSDIDLQVNTVTQTATYELSLLSVEQRQCYLAGESVEGGIEKYSRDECMTLCRLRGMLRLCGCVPYYTPRDFFKNETNSLTYCTMAHFECLERNRVTLNTFTLVEYIRNEAFSNQSLDCFACLPLCNYNAYELRKQINPLRDSYMIPPNRQFLKFIETEHKANDAFNYTYDTLYNLIKTKKDVSIVKIYVSSLYATQFSKRQIFTWYEMMSNIGGIIGIFVGCSCISVFEVVYFFGFKLIAKISKKYKNVYKK